MNKAHPLIISFPLSLPTEWYNNLEEQNLGTTKEGIFCFHPSIGNGTLQYLEFQEGFWIQQINSILKQPLQLIQTAGKTNELFIINFYLTNAPILQQSGDKIFELQFDNVSVMLSSSTAVSRYNIPAQEQVKIFQIGFTRTWLLSNAFDDSHTSLKALFTNDQPLYIAENLDHQSKYLVEEIDLESSNRLFLFSTTLQLLNTFFSKLEFRHFNTVSQSNIHYSDLENLLKVRTYMDQHPLEPISLEKLSKQSDMSLSKFKRLFKQVFGVTPYNYYLQNKMAIAMDSLIQNHSVSEVAFLLGYNNLSHFSKAFKKQYNILPSEVKNKS